MFQQADLTSHVDVKACFKACMVWPTGSARPDTHGLVTRYRHAPGEGDLLSLKPSTQTPCCPQHAAARRCSHSR